MEHDVVDESEFSKWRAIFALCHVDGVVCDYEKRAMKDIIEGLNFTRDQRVILKADMTRAQDIRKLFSHITNQQHRHDFFKFARLIAWSDSEFHRSEQSALAMLQRLNISEEHIYKAIGDAPLEFEDDEAQQSVHKIIELRKNPASEHQNNKSSLLELFIDRYEPSFKQRKSSMDRF